MTPRAGRGGTVSKARPLRLQRLMLVADRMTQPAIRCGPDMTRDDARRLMEQSGVRRLAVVSKGKLVGIVTLSDALSARTGRYVADLMARDPETIESDAGIVAAAVKMRAHKVSGLPVVSGEHLVGMITESDIFGALIDMLRKPGMLVEEPPGKRPRGVRR